MDNKTQKIEEDKLIERDVFKDIAEHLGKKEISLIVGPRQAGKTTLMNLLKNRLEKDGKQTVFLSLDFENDRRYFASQNNLLAKLKLEFGNNRGYVFIDEIQRKENAGLFLKGVYDRGLPYKFIVSGSGSIELKEKIHESLAGRKIIFEIRPISFFELVNFKTDYRYQNKLEDYFSVEKGKSLEFLEEYLNFGGYPRVILAETLQEKIRVIDEIYRSYVERDISLLLRVEKLDAFNSLVKILAGQIGGIINYSEIANTLGISLATVKNYLYYMEKTFIIQRITPYFKNIRKEITKSPSAYFYDLGLRNYVLGIFGNLTRPEDFGFLFQNLVFSVLQERIRFSGAKINFWRTKDKAEVDFVYSLGDKIVPIEAKYKTFVEPAIERSLRSFIEKYKPGKAIVATKDFKERLKIGNTTIEFLPFWDLFKIEL